MGQLIYGDAIHIREQAKIDAGRITTASGNARRGAESALQNFSASLGNMRAMSAAGAAFNDMQGNTARAMASASTGPMRMRLQAAEELGAVAAMAGAAGVGGGAVETYNATVRLTTAMNEQSYNEGVDAQAWAAGQQSGNVISNAVGGLDNNVYRANLDYTQYVDHKTPSFLEKIATVGLTAAATVFGGPQAGSAVMGVFEARQAARNGDFAGATSSLTGAFQNGMSAARSSQATRRGPSPAAPEPQAGLVNPDAIFGGARTNFGPTPSNGWGFFNGPGLASDSPYQRSIIIH